MTQQLPPGQNPIDPRNAFVPPSPGAGGFGPPPGRMGPGMQPGPWMYPPPRKGGWFKTIVIVLLVLGLLGSVIVNFLLMGTVAVMSSSGSSNGKQTTIISGDASSKIAVVPLDGLITDSSITKLDHLLSDVEKDSNVKALVIEIDTPGGSATASDEMFHRVEQFKASHAGIPIVISMRGMATSGGYYVACAGTWIVAEPGTLTGNIGVLFPRFNLSELCGKYGIKEETITATTQGHSFKNAGSMFQPSNPEDEKYLQGLVDDTFKQFKGVVQKGRGAKLNDVQGDIFSGKAFIASDAMTRGLVDQIGYPEDAYAYAAKAANLTNKTVVRFTEPHSLFTDLLGDKSNLPVPSASSSGNVTINGVNIDGQAIRDVITGRPMLLWRAN